MYYYISSFCSSYSDVVGARLHLIIVCHSMHFNVMIIRRDFAYALIIVKCLSVSCQSSGKNVPFTLNQDKDHDKFFPICATQTHLKTLSLSFGFHVAFDLILHFASNNNNKKTIFFIHFLLPHCPGAENCGRPIDQTNQRTKR